MVERTIFTLMNKKQKFPLIISIIFALLSAFTVFILTGFIFDIENKLNDAWDSIGIVYMALFFLRFPVSIFIGAMGGSILYGMPKFLKKKKLEINEWWVFFVGLFMIPAILFVAWLLSYKMRTSLSRVEVTIMEDIYGQQASFLSSPCSWRGVDCARRNRKLRVVTLSLYTGELKINSVPVEISQLDALEHLVIRPQSNLGNYTDSIDGLSGNIPIEIFNLKELKSLEIKGMEFTGNIPSEVGQLTKLEILSLIDSGFSGEIPRSIDRLINLKELDLSSNTLSGELPNALYLLVNLEDVGLEDNQLTGIIHQDISNLNKLSYFSIRNNNFNGKLPSTIDDLPSLKTMWLLNSGLCFDDVLTYSSQVFRAIKDNVEFSSCN